MGVDEAVIEADMRGVYFRFAVMEEGNIACEQALGCTSWPSLGPLRHEFELMGCLNSWHGIIVNDTLIPCSRYVVQPATAPSLSIHTVILN